MIFPAIMFLIRWLAVLHAVLWAPPIADDSVMSDVVAIENLSDMSPEDLATAESTKNLYVEGDIAVRRLTWKE